MTRAGLVLAVALAGIVLLAVITALVWPHRAPTQLPPGSPQATVQAYLAAVLDGRTDAAAALLDPAGACDVTDLDRVGGLPPQGVRVVLLDATVRGDTATVRVELVYGADDPFGLSEHRERHTYRLARADGAWRLAGTPWPLYTCEAP